MRSSLGADQAAELAAAVVLSVVAEFEWVPAAVEESGQLVVEVAQVVPRCRAEVVVARLELILVG